MISKTRHAIRLDLQIIADMVEPGSRVLDVGCGDGALLDHLATTKQVDGRGMELSMEGVRAAVSQGLSVIQGDADIDLEDYPSNAFDYVILSQTLQATYNPRIVLENLLRIGKRAIVSFPNFGYWKARVHLVLGGRMPVSSTLPHQWYETPNIHLCTIKDFVILSRLLGITVVQGIAVNADGDTRTMSAMGRRANLFAEQAVFLLERD
ncbi:MAG: methionine biosynthesis protein MetW [Alphaproteobacteria bacterium RIFOXYD12_FULL_60_8]|nr:MAG: methionine biosynthesis protein MetW [Alphaproteobacteria bacterium RIFOXYD12_FULL_60_8]